MDIIGRLTADAQVRTVSQDRKVVSFTVAVNDSYKAKNGERVTQTEYFDCSYWLGSGIAQYLTKGTLVELTGRVSARAWVNGEGQAKAGLNFHTSKITLHGGGADAGEVPQKGGNGKALKAEAVEVHQEEVIRLSAGAPTPDDDLPF